MRPSFCVRNGFAVHQIYVAQFFRLAIRYYRAHDGRGLIELPVFVTLEGLLEHSIVGIAYGNLEVSNIPHEHLSQGDVPLMEFKG